MESVVVDANVFAAYYKKSVLELDVPDVTGCPEELFDYIKRTRKVIYFDGGDIIENEVKNVVDTDWLTQWFRQSIKEGLCSAALVENDKAIRDSLRRIRYPDDARDRVYLKLGYTLSKRDGASAVVSEDMDFYDFTKKKRLRGDARLEFIRKRRGPVPPEMETHNVCVAPIEFRYEVTAESADE